MIFLDRRKKKTKMYKDEIENQLQLFRTITGASSY